MKKVLAFVVIMLALAALACSSSTIEQLINPPKLPTITPNSTWVLPTAGVISMDETGINIPVLNTGLSAFQSYHRAMTMLIQFTKPDGTSGVSEILFDQQVQNSGNEFSYLLDLRGDVADPRMVGGMAVYRLQNEDYTIPFKGDSAGQCSVLTELQAAVIHDTLFEPGMIFGNFTNLMPVALGEVVNGITADKFVLTQDNISAPNIVQMNAELWLAQPGGYVVRFTGSAIGSAYSLGVSSLDSLISWDYNVGEVNALPPLSLIETCQIARIFVDFPQPFKSVLIGYEGNVLTFDSSEIPVMMMLWYRARMTEGGWTTLEDYLEGDNYFLRYQLGEKTVYIDMYLNTATGGSTVVVTVN